MEMEKTNDIHAKQMPCNNVSDLRIIVKSYWCLTISLSQVSFKTVCMTKFLRRTFDYQIREMLPEEISNVQYWRTSETQSKWKGEC